MIHEKRVKTSGFQCDDGRLEQKKWAGEGWSEEDGSSRRLIRRILHFALRKMDCGDQKTEETMTKKTKETGWRCMRNALPCFFLVFSIDLQKLSSELLLPRHTKLMASPGISTAHSNLLSFSVNSRSLKAMYHYRLYSLTQSQWALGVAAGKCWREVRACFNQQEGNCPCILLGRMWFACKAPFENFPSVWGR